MQHYVKTGKVPPQWGAFYSAMFKYRQDSDYKDFVKFDGQLVAQWLEKAREFVQTLETLFG